MGAAAPRFRRDLHAAEVEADGVMYVEVKDTRSGKAFRFYDFEYAVARKLNGRPLSEVARDLRSELQLELTAEQLEAFSDQLRSLGFLDAEGPDTFFPPLVDDESGEFEMPNLTAAPGPPAALTPRPLTPGPLAMSGKTPTPSPTAAARSLTENTITAYPPEVDPARPAPAAAAPATPESVTPPPLTPAPVTPGPAPKAALEALAAGPFAPATTPAPQLTNGAGASPGSNGSPAAASRPSDPAIPSLASADLEELTDDAQSEPDDAQSDDEHTPIADTRPNATGDAPVDVHAAVTAAGQSASTSGGQPSIQSIKERRELPTQRLRAVTDELAEDPAPRRTPGKSTPAVDADVDDDDDEELESAPSVAGPVPTDSMARMPSGGGLTPAATGGRQAWLAYAALGVAAAGIIAVMVYKYLANPEPPAITVSAMVPSPTTVYRFWDASAKVDRVEAPAFSFSGDGKVAEIAAPGTRYGAGDVLALLEGGKKFRADLAHNRERLGYYEQMRDSMSQQNNKPEVRQAELKIAEKKRLIAEAQAALTKQAILATTPGEVGETLAQVGATVKAGDPAMKAKGTGYRANFELSREDAEKARQLGFCRAEIDGKPLDCSLAAEGGDETHLVVDLPNDPVVGVGKTARLARDRMDAVFSIPASALLKMGDSDRLFVVTPSNRAELRVVAVAERSGNEAIILQGLDVGDRVIVDSPPDLKPDARVLIRETVAK
jgi:hypothetical protein